MNDNYLQIEESVLETDEVIMKEKPQRDEKGRFLPNNDIGEGRPKAFPTLKDWEDAIDGYLESCQEVKDGKIVYTQQPLLSGLAFYTGASKETINQYSKMKGGYSEAFKAFKAKCEYFAEQALFRKGLSPAGVIFNLKVNYGHQDKVLVEQKNINFQVTPELADKYGLETHTTSYDAEDRSEES